MVFTCTRRHLIGALTAMGTVMVTIAVAALAVMAFASNAPYPSAPAALGGAIEKAVQSRFYIQPEVTSAFWKIVHAERKYVIYDLIKNADTGSLEFVVVASAEDAELTGEQSAAWEHMVAQMPEDDCRYGIFDFTYHKDGIMDSEHKVEKVVLLTSRTCRNDVRSQMDITYGITDLLNALPAIDISFMAKLPEERDYETMALRVEACVERDEGCVGSSSFFNPPTANDH